MNKGCCSPFLFCKKVHTIHNCRKDYLSPDCSEWIRKCIKIEESVKRKTASSLQKPSWLASICVTV